MQVAHSGATAPQVGKYGAAVLNHDHLVRVSEHALVQQPVDQAPHPPVAHDRDHDRRQQRRRSPYFTHETAGTSWGSTPGSYCVATSTADRTESGRGGTSRTPRR